MVAVAVAGDLAEVTASAAEEGLAEVIALAAATGLAEVIALAAEEGLAEVTASAAAAALADSAAAAAVALGDSAAAAAGSGADDENKGLELNLESLWRTYDSLKAEHMKKLLRLASITGIIATLAFVAGCQTIATNQAELAASREEYHTAKQQQ